MIVIFDFDHTLFDIKRFFKEDLPGVVGVNKGVFLKTYHENFKHNLEGDVNYILEKHLEILGKNDVRTRKKVDKFFEKADKYLRPGAIELLGNFKKQGDEMYLVTIGNIKWQKMKIRRTKSLAGYFDAKHRIFIEQGKEKAVKFFNQASDEIIIINDKPKESAKMEKMIGKRCRIYIVRSKYSARPFYKGKVYEDLTAVRYVIFSKNAKLI